MRTDVAFLGNGLALTGNPHAPEHGRHIRAADGGGAAGLEGHVHLSSALVQLASFFGERPAQPPVEGRAA